MRRREFIAASCAALLTPGLTSDRGMAQTTRPKFLIGFLSGGVASAYVEFVDEFRKGLQSTGLRSESDYSILFKWADGRNEEIDRLAAELVAAGVDVIAATGGSLTGIAAKKATRTLPVIFMTGSNPTEFGLVENLGRPEGNATGVNMVTNELDTKRLELIRLVAPRALHLGVLSAPGWDRGLINKATEAWVTSKGLRFTAFELRPVQGMAELVPIIRASGIEALLVQYTPPLTSRRAEIVNQIDQLGIPAVYGGREYVNAGGLMSYGSSLAEAYRIVGEYTSQLLLGKLPSDLPVRQPTKYDLYLNVRAARRANIQFPDDLLTLADEVIE